MRVYKCDGCGEIVEKPHEQGLKEFYLYPDFELGVVIPLKAKRKLKVHLCDSCFHALKVVATIKLLNVSEARK